MEPQMNLPVNLDGNYLLMIIAFIGTLLYFPRREQLLAASFKQQI